ncbi:MAG TPA: ATP-binding protein [Longimicrobium sp.]|nr:ATP-binding protein [Longimicrobium sp.]
MYQTGHIHEDAMSFFEDSEADESKVVVPFLDAGFDVTWAKRLKLNNTILVFFLLKPNEDLREAYGFRYEVVLVFHPYMTVEARTFQAINTFMSIDPAKGRVDTMFYFLVSAARDCEVVTATYLVEHKEERIAVPITLRDITASGANGWTVRNALQRHYLTLDRFKNTLPLREDTYFFGRQKELGRLLDASRQGENSGLFGLRKTGKTSLLFKLQRALERDPLRKVLFIDAQSTSVRLRHWNQLLWYICKLLFNSIRRSVTASFDAPDAADEFSEHVEQYLLATDASTLTLIVDEVEWISPATAKDDHWNSEFANFWHAIRTFQARSRKINIVIAGVNPSMVEEDTFHGFQNPLFGIVNTTFLAGLGEDDAAEMIQNIGRVMGLRFQSDALAYFYSQYAGHPMLTRLACSFTTDVEKGKQRTFPVQIASDDLKASASLRDRELRFYCAHIVSELAQFYPAEYELLELLATGRESEFRERTRYNAAISHLSKYGIVSDQFSPRITYEVLRDYIAEENARREGRPTKFHVVAVEDRAMFVRSRMRSIVEDMRTLEGAAQAALYPSLFGPNSFPEAEKLFEIQVPNDEKSLAAALTPCYRSFVESIDNFGSSASFKDYFWSVIKQHYPQLQEALHRVRVYRHDAQHVKLTSRVQAQLTRFLKIDLDGELAHTPERHWIKFQRCLDELHRALQHEIGVLRS